ncbi:MAG: sigma-70 family RNA polymerase sigma factor [Cyclobacteriaceae bacterium]
MHKKETSLVVDHFFRHEYGRVTAFLVRKFGADHLELVEDAVQESLYKAVKLWPFSGIPQNPSGWITRSAQNKLIDDLRRIQRFDQKAKIILDETVKEELPDDVRLQTELKDDLLKMMFACCRPEISEEYQIILVLKILCGFGNQEIALALFKSEEAVAKAYLRSKQKLKETSFLEQVPTGHELNHRLENLLRIIYLLFNEGYKASHGQLLVRKELCFEAIRLTSHILDHASLPSHHANSLMALMHFQASRFESRISEDGVLLTLEEQDRGKWDRELIAKGMRYLDKAAEANVISEYYLQAGIAAMHCFAQDFESTSWKNILRLYDLLLKINPSKIISLNRVVASAKVNGAQVALNELEKLADEKLEAFYLFHAIQADLFKELTQLDKARASYLKASSLADNELERNYLNKKASNLP